MSTRPPLEVVSSTNQKNEVVRLQSDDKKPRIRSVTDKSKLVNERDDRSRLKLEVEALRARVARRDETIVKLQARAKDNGPMREIEHELQDLVQRHSDAKTKHRSELDVLRLENDALRKDAEAQKTKEASLSSKLTDVRSKLALSEAEIGRLRNETSARPSATTGTTDDRIVWNKAKIAMESDIRKLEKEVERSHRKLAELQEVTKAETGLRAENERLKYGWDVMARQYGDLYNTLLSTRQSARESQTSTSCEIVRLQGRVQILEEELAHSVEERTDLLDQLTTARRHIESLTADLADLVELHRTNTRAVSTGLDIDDHITPLGPFVDVPDMLAVTELASGHAHICTVAQQDSEEHIMHLTNSIIELERSVHDLHSRLMTSESTHAQFVTEHEALRAEHAPCGATLSQLRFELDQANRVVDNRGAEVNDVRLELCRVNERSERQADLLQRANENVLRAKFAQDALEEEVEHLRTKFIEAAGFEEQYHDLLERQQLLETREAVAIEQAERVAMENAELMGHTNGSQKIGYVDGVRREIALCRQELAATRHHLNVANDRIATLENEIEAYKTISPESIPAAGRTRVVRRQPEGGRLTASMSASGTRRISVTGPGGAKRLI